MLEQEPLENYQKRGRSLVSNIWDLAMYGYT